MTSRTAWVIVIFGLLSAFALMLGLVLGSGIASTVIAALGTIGALAGLVTQLMPSTGEKPAAHADSKPATTRPPAGTGLGRRPWLVLVTGLGVVAALGGALVLVRPNGRAASGGGTLRVSLDTSQPSSIDLTADGTVDWIKWGYLDADASNPNEFAGGFVRDVCKYNAHCTVRKKGGNQIGDFVAIGNVSPYRLHYRDDPVGFRWSDGTPVAAASGIRSQVYMGLAGNGFQITVPANRHQHEFTLFAGTHQARTTCVATLSDSSAAPVQDSTFDTFGDPTGSKFGAFTFTYRAAHDDATLTVTITVLEYIGGANVSIFGAMLR